jgi:hypothetical protein
MSAVEALFNLEQSAPLHKLTPTQVCVDLLGNIHHGVPTLHPSSPLLIFSISISGSGLLGTGTVIGIADSGLDENSYVLSQSGVRSLIHVLALVDVTSTMPAVVLLDRWYLLPSSTLIVAKLFSTLA